MIRIDAVWLATEPMDMRAGTDTALARVVKVFGAAHPHQAYLFANRRANRMKVLVHDGIGIWLAARRLHQGQASASGPLRLASHWRASTVKSKPRPTRCVDSGFAVAANWRRRHHHRGVMGVGESSSLIMHGGVLKSLFGHARIGAQGDDGHTARHGSGL